MHAHIKGFRRINDAIISGDQPVSILVGLNQHGKSSLLGGIAVALTGTHPDWLSRRGETLTDLRNSGCTKAELHVTIGQVHVGRLINGRGQELQCGDVGGEQWDGNMTVQQQRLLDTWGLTKAQLECLLHGSEFLGMDTKGQTEFLASISGAELTSEQLREKIHADSPVGMVMSPLDTWKSDLSGSALLDACLKTAEDRRRDAKRLVTQKEALLQAAQGAVAPRPEGEAPEDVAARVDDIDGRLDAAQRAAGAIEQADGEVSERRETVVKATAELEAAQAAADEAPRDELEAAKQAASEAKALLDAAGDEVDAADREEQDLETRLIRARSELEDLDDLASEPECPRCTQLVPSYLIARMVDEAKGAMGRLETALATSREKLSEVRARRSEQANAAGVAASNADDLARKVADLDAVVDRATRLKLTAEQALERATEKRAAIADPEDTAALELEVGVLQAWVSYLGGLQAVREAEAAAEEARGLVAPWDWLCEKFGSGPDSYRRELTQGKLTALEAAVNEALEPMLQEQIAFPRGDSGLQVLKLGGRYPATRQYLSGSELARLQVALQYGLCKALRFPLLLVDVQEDLDWQSRAALLGMLRRASTTWDELRVVVAMSPTVPDWKAGLKPAAFEGWAQVWEVADGRAICVLDPSNPFDNPKPMPTEDGQTVMMAAS